MNWNLIVDHWDTFRPKLRQRWGRLSDADLDEIGTRRERVVQTVENRYGISAEQADAQLLEWQKDMEEEAPTLVLWEPLPRRQSHPL